MGILDEAVKSATAGKAAAEASTINRERNNGERYASQLAERYGLNVEWLDRIEVTSYSKRLRQFGGGYDWNRSRSDVDRFQVEDIVLGAYAGTYANTPVTNDFCIWQGCPSCATRFAIRLSGYISTTGTVEESRAILIHKIGVAVINESECTRCQARPCSECGRT
jgi:hypothetical protein